MWKRVMGCRAGEARIMRGSKGKVQEAGVAPQTSTLALAKIPLTYRLIALPSFFCH